MKRKMMINADIIGVDGTLWQTQEECAELIQAIAKYNRVRGYGQVTPMDEPEAFQNLVEEIGDVEICIKQLKYLLDISTDKTIRKKVNRTYERYEKDIQLP